MVRQKQSASGKELRDSDQLAVFRETFASFNNTIKRLNESYATLQARYQQLSDELTATNEKLREVLDQNLQTKNFLQNVLESLTAGVITIDLEGRIKSINRSGCESFISNRSKSLELNTNRYSARLSPAPTRFAVFSPEAKLTAISKKMFASTTAL